MTATPPPHSRIAGGQTLAKPIPALQCGALDVLAMPRPADTPIRRPGRGLRAK